ncbi:MAG: hypothetical protein GX078_05285, partial [Clostridiales bacterium]|nr:hypothetical protein [Clostridiales bacterium]
MNNKIANRLMAICLAILMIPTLAPMSIFAEEAILIPDAEQQEVLLTEDENIIQEPEETAEPTAEEPEELTSPDALETAEPLVEELKEDAVEENKKVEEIEEPEITDQTLSKTVNGVTVNVSGRLPVGTTLSVEQASVSVEGMDVLCAFDIKLWLDGKELEPGSSVGVSFFNVKKLEEDVAVVHIKDNGSLEKVTANISENLSCATFRADSFSIYAIGSVSG